MDQQSQKSFNQIIRKTQDHFYKANPDNSWKPGDHSMSNPSNQMLVERETNQSLQQKVNRHRETAHRNLFVEYN